MPYIASFDVGTTNVKGILVTPEGRIAHAAGRPLEMIRAGGGDEQHPDDWTAAVFDILREWFAAGVVAKDIALVALCGQMQDLIALDEDLRPVRPAILYSDGRAGEQAEAIAARVGHARIEEITANPFNGTIVLPKLLWLKEREPEAYRRTSRILISAKDYVVARLTGVTATDATSASTAGCMNLAGGDWDYGLIESAGLDARHFPRILLPGEVAGVVHESGAAASGLVPGTPVLCGFGDAGAATLGAGVADDSQAYLYLGSTGWVAAASERYIGTASGAFNLAFYRRGLYISIAPLLNAGNVHAWAAETFGADGGANAAERFGTFERMAEAGLARKSSLLFLPYLHGERCPVQDPAASGCYIGIKPDTGREELAAAVLEGISLSIRQVVETLLGESGAKGAITAIGGGTRSRLWCRLLADVLDVELRVPEQSPYLPALGAAMPGFEVLEWEADIHGALNKCLDGLQHEAYAANRDNVSYYQDKYAAFRRLYPALRTLWT